MEKPLSVKREDFLQAIVKAVNEAELPAFVALEVLKGVTAEVANVAQRQLEAERQAYLNSLAEKKEEADEECQTGL